MFQGQPMYPMVTNFHLDILQFLASYSVAGPDAAAHEELIAQAHAGLKADMKLLTDQRAAFRKNLEKADELRKRIDLCPICGSYIADNEPVLKPCAVGVVEEPKGVKIKEYGPDGLEIDPQNIPCCEAKAEPDVITVGDVVQEVEYL